jgi:hypothetical protein
MKYFTLLTAATLTASCLMASTAWADNAPGEDPVILSKKITVQMSPMANKNPSSPMDGANDMPAWLKAKVARFEAKSNANQTAGMLTDTDVTRTATSDGFKKTCIQEVGSSTADTSTAGSRSGTGGQQIVVLRGDLVNICK